MNQQDFEARVLELWTKSRVPLTRSNLLAYTKVPRAKMTRWLDEMIRDQIVELDSDDDGELLWKVRGSARPARGPETIGEVDRVGRLSAEVDKLKSGASLALRAAGIQAKLQRPSSADRKSILASGALSFFLGPLGWLYAAPLKEALPAIAASMLVSAILPRFILMYLLGPVGIASAIAGVLYAWSYNQEGRRVPLLLKDRPPALPPLKKR